MKVPYFRPALNLFNLFSFPLICLDVYTTTINLIYLLNIIEILSSVNLRWISCASVP